MWHQRFGDLNEKNLHISTSQQLVDDFDYNVSKQTPFCESCIEGKLHKTPYSSQGKTQAAVPLGLVHSDVCMPYRRVNGVRRDQKVSHNVGQLSPVL